MGTKREGDELDSKRHKKAKMEKQDSIEYTWCTSSDIRKMFSDQWARPEFKNSGDLSFQQIDLDKIIEYRDGEPVPVIRIFGSDENGSSVACFVQNFKPYFYVKAPKGMSHDYTDQFMQALNAKMMENVKTGGQFQGLKKAVLGVELCKKENIYGYSSKGKEPFLKITASMWNLMATFKKVLEIGFEVETSNGVKREQFSLFESNIDFEIRFMVDQKIKGASWITLPKGKWGPREKIETTCSIECTIDYKDIIAHEPEEDWAKIAPLRILSYDIECAGRKGIFPEAEHDPVIQIAAMVQRQGDSAPFIRVIFTLNSCGSIVGNKVLCFEKESQLLDGFAEFIRLVDPDIITGYNIVNFDSPYIINRAEKLKCNDFPFLGRLRNNRTKIRDARFSSKQMGTREYKEINLEGRVHLDVLVSILQNYKLRSYSLNAVSYHFLQEQKEDVHHSIITDLQNGDATTRRRLAVYCLKDALLPIRLIDKLMIMINTIEMARVTGVPISYLLTRGQSVKVLAQILRESSPRDLVLPVVKTSQDNQFEGATVIDPIRGYYKQPITTLDFASLYPSIMRAHNLCYTTLINNKSEKDNLGAEDFIKTPTGDEFVKSNVREGLLPMILKNLLDARARAKKALKIETCPFKKKVLDGRQLALKISANSVYGFTGAQVGKLPCLEISSSVTSFGRLMIDQTKHHVEEKYTIANGYKHDAKVIYGDTDSVMIKFGSDSIAECFDLGAEAAKFVTTKFVQPIKLEFEKVYCPYLLINKKRYAGLYFSSSPDKHDKMDCKGLETVRRDNCRLASELISKCLDMMLINADPDGALEHAKNTIRLLLQNRIDISKLVITKELTKKGEDYASKQAHCELAARMKKRDAGSAPQLGDRVPYVFIQKPKGTPGYDKAEDPLFVLENSIPIDVEHYLHHALENPLLRIFEPILGEGKAKSVLFKGDHTRVKTVQTSKAGGLFAFAKKRNQCIGCKAAMPDGQKSICRHCEDKEAELYIKQEFELQELKVDFARLWTQCQRCQGNMQEKVICSNSDCPIFYRRKKIRTDLKKAEEQLAKFGPIDW